MVPEHVKLMYLSHKPFGICSSSLLLHLPTFVSSQANLLL